MSDTTLAADVNTAARLAGAFKLRSGQVSSEYFDKYRFEADPLLLRRVAVRMLSLVPPDAEILAGLELGGVPIATAMSLQSGLPAVFVRKKAKDYGTCQAVEGGDIGGRRVVLVEDVITTGGAVVDAARLVREAGGIIVGCHGARDLFRGPNARRDPARGRGPGRLGLGPRRVARRTSADGRLGRQASPLLRGRPACLGGPDVPCGGWRSCGGGG